MYHTYCVSYVSVIMPQCIMMYCMLYVLYIVCMDYLSNCSVYTQSHTHIYIFVGTTEMGGNHIAHHCEHFNSLRLSDAYMHQYNIPPLLQIMAWHLFGAKPLSEPMLPYCQLDPKEHISVKLYLKFKRFHSRKCTWKCRLPKWRPSCPTSMCWLQAVSITACKYASRGLLY